MHLVQFKQLGALADSGAWVALHEHERHVVQRGWVQLRLRPAGGHACIWYVRGKGRMWQSRACILCSSSSWVH
jgi:hypothetical protein